MPTRYDRRSGGRPSQPRPPTPEEWTKAPLTVGRHASADGAVTGFELIKQIERGGRTFKTSVWLSVSQMRGMARDHGSGA